MNSAIFLLLVVALLLFFYRISERFPVVSEAFLSRIIELIPRWDDHADIKSLILCVAVMLFILGILIVIFH
jgi:hypothetical protein